jgi:hypothetical protein
VRVLEQLPRVSPALAASDGAALRFSVGPWREMERALYALDAALRAVTCA